MSMQLTIPSDVEALVQKRLDRGDFTNAEDVVRRALEVLDGIPALKETVSRLLVE